jgi:SMC interacting uncharacterized protein involved in chromosome segregation
MREDLVLVRNKVSAKNSAVIDRLQTEIATAERDIDALKQSLRAQITELMRDRAQDEYTGKMLQFQEQIDLMKELEKTLQAELAKLVDETRGLKTARDQRLSQLENEMRELKAVVADMRKGK